MVDRESARRLLLNGPVTHVPAIYDGFSARIAEDVGFTALAISGNALSVSLLGMPDVGLITTMEVVAAAGRIVRSVNVPVICDADTGYGSVLNVVRTVHEFEAAGVAAIHLEDQLTPKRCGLLAGGVPVVDAGEHVKKIRAAVRAREDPDFVIIARTDAKGTLGLNEAARRARLYLEAGADAAMVIGANTAEDLRVLYRETSGPFVHVVHESNASIHVTDDELNEFGCTLAIHGSAARGAAVRALYKVLGALRRDGDTRGVADQIATLEEYNRTVGLEKWLELERTFVDGF